MTAYDISLVIGVILLLWYVLDDRDALLLLWGTILTVNGTWHPLREYATPLFGN